MTASVTEETKAAPPPDEQAAEQSALITEQSALVAGQSFLIADCGSTNTMVALFDIAAGSYYLIARTVVPTTSGPPWYDVSEGIRQAITHITEITGRPLLDKDGTLIKPAQSDGRGVDHFAAAISAARPLSTIMVGLADDVSLASARRALSNIYVHEADTFNLSDKRSEKEQVASFLQHQPDLVFITGGTDGGAEQRLMRLVEHMSLGVNVLAELKKPHVLYAGNIKLREHVRKTIGERVPFIVSDNIRPDLNSENLNDTIKTVRQLYEEKMKALPGIQTLVRWSTMLPQPTAQTIATITDYFAKLHQGRVLSIDVGSNSTTLVVSDPQQRDLTIRTDLGMGQPMANLLTLSSPNCVARWLPNRISEKEISDFVHNKALYPQTIPVTEAELALEQAAAREIMRHILEDSLANWHQAVPRSLPIRLLLARGGVLTNAPRLGHIVLMLLDALQPSGIFPIALDRHGILPALGLLAEQNPLAAVQILEKPVLDNLGWVIAPTGNIQPEQKVLSIVIASPDSGELEIEVMGGTLEVIPLPPDEKTEITLKPTRRVDIGFGRGNGKKITVQGGSVGLIVDARGRPLILDADDPQAQMRRWLWDVGG